MVYSPRIKNLYKDKVPALIEEFKYSSSMQIPRLKKIVLSQGLGSAVADKKIVEYAIQEMSAISGQKAVPCLSKRDEAGFKLRKDMPIGVKVTLRRDIMFEFLDRLITAALPRVRDFNGINPKGFDGRGNYNMGISEQIIFPEISIDKIKKISGMDITFVTSSKSDKEALSLLRHLGLPFKKN
ncbi:50S ribosomal protein L5 [Bacteroidetes bacterium endosymbiont of Geopemphigus sp.]|uniref:50S ribosomal protein L5 n=1 Tax=Bacteroidetes bacterium endosymbiont of Geopemphigus sp. TaxID=2047937 RepID=UPI000CD14763|nr:50S ribosomal protein L5 [Bacteroidetes bacterium endosymbiont of Geopemphigus sp.]